jgi:hypothetical protein
LRRLDLRHQNAELVAADPTHDVARAEAAAELTRYRAQGRVAGGVSGRVVGRLEVVEVDDQQRPGRVAAPRAREMLFYLLLESPVVETGQLVVVREVVQSLQATPALAGGP